MSDASTPRFLQGRFPFEGVGFDTLSVIDDSLSLTVPALFLPVFPGLDDPAGVVGGSYSTGNNDNVGPNPNPFPYLTTTQPGGATYNAADTVLRTNALSLSIAPSGIQVDGATGTSTPAGPTGLTNGPQGTQSFITGQSGGQANLFGNIPGKSDAIDVTVNLRTTINSIFLHRIFFDGRANNFFNGLNPFGETDPDAKVLVKSGPNPDDPVNLERMLFDHAATASQAVGPPGSPFEMSFDHRTWPHIGHKLVVAKPLAGQQVAQAPARRASDQRVEGQPFREAG